MNVYQIQHEHFRPPNVPDRFMAVSKRFKTVSKTLIQIVRNFERLSTLEPERSKAFDSGKHLQKALMAVLCQINKSTFETKFNY